MPKTFYITTPIFYVNDAPHIGHAYTEVAADVLARWHRQRGEDSYLLTGTDEHGEKVLRTAVANQVDATEWTDKLVQSAWLPLLDTINIDNQDFIRTTEPRHKVAVQKFLQQLFDAGFIYRGSFVGNYCVGCEEYKNESDLVSGSGEHAGQQVCAIHSKPVEQLDETNYFFKLSEFQERLLKLYETQPDFVQPASARNEVVSFVRSGLSDLSISRSKERFDWGIDIPWDSEHITYVWFDALLNYITALGFGEEDSKFYRYWPANYQIVGKDILRFHAVIWPAMLMAAGLEPPRRVFGHGWLLVGGEKMSKSKLTGIAPNQITDSFGSDAFRYYFMRAISFGSDGSFSWEDLAARYQAELANGLGNLASRVVAMFERYCSSQTPEWPVLNDAERSLQTLIAETSLAADAAIDNAEIHEAINKTWRIVDELNLFITESEPWVLAKDPAQRERLNAVLMVALDGLRALAVLLHPVMPIATAKLWNSIGGGLGSLSEQLIQEAGKPKQIRSGSELKPLEPLFPRLEAAE